MKQDYVIFETDGPLKSQVWTATSTTAAGRPGRLKSEHLGRSPDLMLRGGPKAGSSSTIRTMNLTEQDAHERRQESRVRAVAPVMPMRLIAPVVIKKSSASAVKATAELRAWGLEAVGTPRKGLDGRGIVVAVLDTGIDPTHPAFKGVELVRRNFTQEDDDDIHGHGTHCAGTILGREVDGVRIGVAPGIKKVLIGKVLGKGGGGSDQIEGAIQWAVDGGAHVISMSLGMDFPDYFKSLMADGMKPEPATSLALEGYRANLLLFESLAAYIGGRGLLPGSQPTLLIAAAGNESQRTASVSFQIAVSPPAVSGGFISVAALE